MERMGERGRQGAAPLGGMTTSQRSTTLELGEQASDGMWRENRNTAAGYAEIRRRCVPLGWVRRFTAAVKNRGTVETLRAGVVVMHDVTGRLETVFPDEAAISRIAQVVEAARGICEYIGPVLDGPRFRAAREALGALDG